MMERGSGDRSLNHLTDEHWDFPTDLTDLHGRVSHRFRRFTRISTRCVRGFHGGELRISQVHADEILSVSHGGH